MGAEPAAPGKFITFEGIDGAGKSTQAAMLGRSLKDAGIDVLLTREPGGAPGAEKIRDLLVKGEVDKWAPMTEVLLHYAARHEHLEHTVLPALAAGRWVLSDRFADSTMAYQGFGHQLGRRTVAGLHRLIVGDFAPDLTVILDVSVEEGLRRAAARSGAEDRYERMPRTFHQRLRQGYLDIAERERNRCAVVDAGGGAESVREAVRRLVGERMGVAL
ncbi:MAG: dTMP kinase [Rhodospirillales bacterium]|jgi:dTMP kinase|nr:dTMP kinase [Rhodospirillales bacterium]HIJ42676.1 dTMP kinase [Rhodospirillaceae bacterium]MDP7098135.1 dTMP kinase [Rhodospirillales bacterium]MDP7214478.1 dTMP kinase [Rhodospirillales bacterium]HIJ46320.1 dTMP kinase [Rhodospirillaceae bacterium]